MAEKTVDNNHYIVAYTALIKKNKKECAKLLNSLTVYQPKLDKSMLENWIRDIRKGEEVVEELKKEKGNDISFNNILTKNVILLNQISNNHFSNIKKEYERLKGVEHQRNYDNKKRNEKKSKQKLCVVLEEVSGETNDDGAVYPIIVSNEALTGDIDDGEKCKKDASSAWGVLKEG